MSKFVELLDTDKELDIAGYLEDNFNIEVYKIGDQFFAFDEWNGEVYGSVFEVQAVPFHHTAFYPVENGESYKDVAPIFGIEKADIEKASAGEDVDYILLGFDMKINQYNRGFLEF